MYTTNRGLLLVTAALASWCLTGCGTSLPPSTAAQDGGKGATVPAQWTDSRLEIDVPVQVITFGLPEKAVVELRSQLTPLVVDHKVDGPDSTLSPDIEESQTPTETFPAPVLPIANFDVRAAPAALEQEFTAVLQQAQLEPGLYDANMIEDWLAQALSRHGLALNPDTPSLVMLHLGAFGISGHHWKIQGHNGYLKLARVFGERHPLLVLDPSADADPYAGTDGYRSPVATDDVTQLAEFILDATEYRLLQGSLFPVATAPCHAVTGILAVRATSASQHTTFLGSVYDTFNPALIKASFDHLTGGAPVFFDVKILSLPVDDPVLDAVGRGDFEGREALRTYLTQNWEQYHVDHPGCEEYLSLVFVGDAATAFTLSPSGIAAYDDQPGKRLSMSWLGDIAGLLFSPDSPFCSFNPMCGTEGVFPDSIQIWNDLFSHETGHLFGQMHPHNIDRARGADSNNAFSSIWSSMSYQTGPVLFDFGAVDQANWQRNRAGYALLEASRAGREGSPEWNAALEAATQLDWQGVWAALQN